MKLRLLRVAVIPEFVVEDDEGNLAPLGAVLTNEDGSPMLLRADVLARDWAAYSSEGFVKAQAEIEARLLT
jgi:hypothetical protein